MKSSFLKRTAALQKRISEAGVDLCLIQDSDSVYYFSGFWGYLGMQFGRPTLLMIPATGNCQVITPSLEAEMAQKMTWIQDIVEWSDGVNGEWRTSLRNIIKGSGSLTVGIEKNKTHPVISDYLRTEWAHIRLVDIADIIDEMRMIKTEEELAIMRQAGQVSVAMCRGGLEAIAEGTPEYEIALAVIAAGTRKAAEFLTDEGPERLFSPMIYNLQVLQSGGPDLSMVHRRPTLRRVRRGESVYMCFCEMNNFRGFKLGFDRQYWVG
ncbi:MAG: aminopeptidase P family N-terminal domain-containing protein, partial [Desulfobacterales bacterium]